MNRLLYRGDCLEVLRDHNNVPDHSVDLIYLDPPFNSASKYNLPFKGKDRGSQPVMAFEDTWTWKDDDIQMLAHLESNRATEPLADIIRFAQGVEAGKRGKNRSNLAAYLLHMALRLQEMRRVLKATGSIYLHCDPTASHYLKLLMDSIFGKRNFRNEILWVYEKRARGAKAIAKQFARNNDIILYYSRSSNWIFNPPMTKELLSPQEAKAKGYRRDDKGWFKTAPRGDYTDESIKALKREGRIYITKSGSIRIRYPLASVDGKVVDEYRIGSCWDDIADMMHQPKRMRLGYPTQKPQPLLQRIIETSTHEGMLVLDPFCGCGTTVHVAERLKRRWIGIDISRFATGMIRRHIIEAHSNIRPRMVKVSGVPETVDDAKALALQDKFEFEKWVCGSLGANGLSEQKRPGDRGPDSGVDGIMEVDLVRNQRIQSDHVVIQVKGGNVSPDSVKALSETVRRQGAVAGVLVCFEHQLGTVENQRSKETWSDDYEEYPIIQGYSIEDLLADKPLQLPPRYGKKRRSRT